MTKETYLKSVDVLLDAYNNGQLFHNNCQKCAVGNLLQCTDWSLDFYTSSEGLFDRRLADGGLSEDEIQEFDNLYLFNGFTRKELMRIENSFEMALYNSEKGYRYYTRPQGYQKEGQYLGLCAVLKVMETMVEEDISADSLIAENRLNTIADKYCVNY